MGNSCRSREEKTRNGEPAAAGNEYFEAHFSKIQEEKTIEKRVIAITLFPLHSNNKLLLNFETGDQLIIEDDHDPDWYLARHVYEGHRGFVLKSYLSLDPFKGEESWFFDDTDRVDAERLLLHPDNDTGAFLVRRSNAEGSYALSMRDINPDPHKVWIPHFKIRTLERGGFYISRKETFSTLQDLVEYYSKGTEDVYPKLKQPCLRPRVSDPLRVFSHDEYEIPSESLEFVRALGKGSFGKVCYGVWNGKVEVAIKRFVSKSLLDREAAVMKAFSHPKIVTLYAVCTEKEPFCIVMEYMCNGSLQDYMRTDIGKKLLLPSLVNISAQIAEGMMYLEANDVIHGDLSASNILVGPCNVVKLAGFGQARITDEAVSVANGGNLPVERVTQESLTIKSDVCSFGILLYEIFTHGRSPYSGMKNAQVVQLIAKRGYRLLRPSDPDCTDAVYEIMTMCWKKEPRDRPTFEFLHHFFADFTVTSEEPKAEVPNH